jgi:hypothetical protein
MFDSGLNVEKENSCLFSKYILSVFPHVKIECLTQGNDRKRFYVGIELKPLLPLHNLSDKLCFENIAICNFHVLSEEKMMHFLTACPLAL